MKKIFKKGWFKKNWLLLLAITIGIVYLAYSMYTPANILGIPFFSKAFAVIGPTEKAYAGDTFEHTFTLLNRNPMNLPRDLYDSDGDGVADTRILLYKGYRMNRYNTLGTQEIVTTGCDTPDGACDYVEEITTVLNAGAGTTDISLVFTVIDTTPSSYEGHPYGVSAMLFKVEQKWDRTTNDWTETPTIIDDINSDPSLGVTFDVSTQTPPPTPTAAGIMAWFAALFASIWEALKGLFGWV